MSVVDGVVARLREVYGGKRWLIAYDVLAGAPALVGELQRLGATGALCIAGSRGTGPLPDADFAPDPILLGVAAEGVMESIRAALAALKNPPPEVVARIDAYDPDGELGVLGTIFDDGLPLAGRAMFGGRRPEWQALEDKLRAEELWAAAGLPAAEARIVPVEAEAVTGACAELDRGDGCVLVGDNKEGFHGGAELLRWVRTEEQAEEARAFFAPRCDRVRVMPFLEGIPCSIHGLVLPDHVVVLRPCEMLVFRSPGSVRLRYGRAATYWDPAPADREQMRSLARQLGEHLRATVGYRGFFTLDGVMAAEGFRPTELNPRVGAAVGLLGVPELPLLLLDRAVIEGVDFGPVGTELEEVLLRASDDRRAGGCSASIPREVEEHGSLAMVWEDDGFRPAREGETVDAQAQLGPASFGSYLRVRLPVERTPVGPSAAPRAIAALACADRRWTLGLGTLLPAKDVRAR